MEANGNIQQARNQVGPVPRNGVTPDVARARKIRKRQRTPTTLQEGNSEHIVLPNKDGVFVVSAAAKRRKMETKNEAKIIHGASDVDRSPLYDGLWATTMTYAPVSHLKGLVRSSKKMMRQIIPDVVRESITEYEKSQDNLIRSIDVLYSGGLMSKAKYKAARLASSFKPKKRGDKRRKARIPIGRMGLKIPALVPYDQVIKFIKSIDMGVLKDVRDFCDDLDVDEDEQMVDGKYRELGDILIRLASMYIKLEKEGAIKLLWFDRNEYSFSISLGADGAPFGKDDEACAFLLSFLNTGARVASNMENFLLLGANCSETHPAMVKYTRKLVSDVKYLEGKVFQVDDIDVKFYFDLIPSDMKWITFFSGELNNAATFFSTFGNVSTTGENKAAVINGKLGTGDDCTWKPWTYESRLENAAKVESFKQTLTKYAPSTQRTKVLNYMSKDLKTRQEFVPIIERLVDKALLILSIMGTMLGKIFIVSF